MPFTNLPATPETDWTNWAFRLQFWHAVREKWFGSLYGWGENVDMQIDQAVNGIAVTPPADPVDGEVWAVLRGDGTVPHQQLQGIWSAG